MLKYDFTKTYVNKELPISAQPFSSVFSQFQLR